ncbi:hypothetical protein NW762_008812 [Fusarium torreyae]|uniref:Uncharacterized protein n=1 Tax=Fusarium torreyae TaxID=1237075 RepID=A0A9W8RW21_9HYPO|nr:hypothetical protein NW762_008812 [Fusarium torreyae]
MDPHTIRQFPYTQLYSDIQEGLRNLLMKKMAGKALRLLPNQRYWISLDKPRRKHPGGCWCTDDSTRACKPYTSCKRRPRPVLGKDMYFLTCYRAHCYGRDCLDRVCFDPNDSASEYLDKLVSERAMRPSLFCIDFRSHVETLLAEYEVSERQYEPFANTICLIIEDLKNPFLDAGGDWNPEVHGVLNWYRKPITECVDELMYEVAAVRLGREISCL